MADTLTSKVALDGPRKAAYVVTNVSDSTGGTQTLDISALTPAPTRVAVEYIQYNIQGYEYVTLKWDNGTDENIAVLSADGFLDWRNIGGLHNAETDGTGDILITTGGTAVAGDTYNITIGLKKEFS